jgi:hypothetical protein
MSDVMYLLKKHIVDKRLQSQEGPAGLFRVDDFLSYVLKQREGTMLPYLRLRPLVMEHAVELLENKWLLE